MWALRHAYRILSDRSQLRAKSKPYMPMSFFCSSSLQFLTHLLSVSWCSSPFQHCLSFWELLRCHYLFGDQLWYFLHETCFWIFVSAKCWISILRSLSSCSKNVFSFLLWISLPTLKSSFTSSFSFLKKDYSLYKISSFLLILTQKQQQCLLLFLKENGGSN